MENEKKLFRKGVRRERTQSENSVRALVEKFIELDQILSYIADPIDKISMKYLSTLYSESSDLIKSITVFMMHEKYCGMHKNIDDSIIKAQELVGILKEFRDLNITRKAHGLIDEDSINKASFLLLALKRKMKELTSITIVAQSDINQDGAHCLSMSFFYLLKFSRSSI